MNYQACLTLIATHIPKASVREALELASAIVVASDPHAARLAWLQEHITTQEAQSKPIQAIKALRDGFRPTPTLKEAKDAVDNYRMARA